MRFNALQVLLLGCLFYGVMAELHYLNGTIINYTEKRFNLDGLSLFYYDVDQMHFPETLEPGCSYNYYIWTDNGQNEIFQGSVGYVCSNPATLLFTIEFEAYASTYSARKNTYSATTSMPNEYSTVAAGTARGVVSTDPLTTVASFSISQTNVPSGSVKCKSKGSSTIMWLFLSLFIVLLLSLIVVGIVAAAVMVYIKVIRKQEPEYQSANLNSETDKDNVVFLEDSEL